MAGKLGGWANMPVKRPVGHRRVLADDLLAAVVVTIGHVQPKAQVGRHQPNGKYGANRPQHNPVEAIELAIEPVGPVLQLLGVIRAGRITTWR